MMPESVSGVGVKGLAHRTLWLVRLRWLAVAGLVTTVLAEPPVFGVPLETRLLLTVASILFAYNLVFHLYARSLVRAAEEGRAPGYLPKAFANLQISADLCSLTALLHYSGGVENPFAYYYVFHMIIASILLSVRASYLQATLATFLYAGMLFLEYEAPSTHHHLTGYASLHGEMDPKVLAGAVVVLGSTLYIAVFFASSIAQQLRRREAQLVAAKESLEEKTHLLAQANVNLAELEHKKSRFMRVAAHQLRSPLAAIRSCLKVVIDGFLRDDPEREMDMLQRADARLQTMLDLVNELLALSQIRDAGFKEEDKEDVCLDEVIRTAVGLHMSFAQARQIDLSVDTQPPHCVVRADKNALQEVLSNLVSNAIKYTPPGGRVSVRTYRESGHGYCEIKDSGIGIPEDEMGHLFDEFFRASNARKLEKEGSGLGLSIVREIVQRHGGDISVESKLNEGTTVRFYVPCTRPEAEPA